MLVEYIGALTLIFFAEMGDKTQILAMAFATKYSVKKVLLGILIGSFLNHAIAVWMGHYIGELMPIDTIQVIAGFSFVAFALLTLREDEDEDNESNNVKYGPVVTVALAFFIGELGDKTQLAAMTLSADANYPLVILLGTVTGMVIVGGIGIYIGKKLGNRIPEFTIKIVSASVFMFFGVLKLVQSLPKEYLKAQYIIIFITVVVYISYMLLKPTLAMRKQGIDSKFSKGAQKLYDFYNELGLKVHDICLTKEVCGDCDSSKCVIGYTKDLLKEPQISTLDLKPTEVDILSFEKEFNKAKIVKSLAFVIEFLDENEEFLSYDKIISIKDNFEKILLEGQIIEFKNKEDYMKKLSKIDNHIYNRVLSYL